MRVQVEKAAKRGLRRSSDTPEVSRFQTLLVMRKEAQNLLRAIFGNRSRSSTGALLERAAVMPNPRELHAGYKLRKVRPAHRASVSSRGSSILNRFIGGYKRCGAEERIQSFVGQRHDLRL